MSKLLLVGNPARRKTAKKRPSAAQMRARAAFAARARSRRKSAPKRKATTVVVRANPIKGRRTRRRVTRARRNPISLGGLNMRSIVAQLKEAGIGAAGALGVDIAYGYAQSYLPDAIKSPTAADGTTNYAYYAAKGATALAVGMLLKKVIGANKANAVVNGSLIVTAHDLLKTVTTAQFSGLTLGYYGAGRNAGGTLPASLGMQVSRARPQLVQNRQMAGVGAYVSPSRTESVLR